jgi:hypothetical protein
MLYVLFSILSDAIGIGIGMAIALERAARFVMREAWGRWE